MMKKHLVEGVVPVLIELKRALEGQQHWLLRDLLAAIRMLLKDYKHEVSVECAQCRLKTCWWLPASIAGSWIDVCCICKLLGGQRLVVGGPAGSHLPAAL